MKMIYFKKDKLQVKVCENRDETGRIASEDISLKIRELLLQKDEINIVFAAAPSQNEMLKSLVSDKRIEWGRINAFHMDEYIGLQENMHQSFGTFLAERIFNLVGFKSVHYINGETNDLEVECERYSDLILKSLIDIVCLGIGENGHLAFNDPHVADFKDKKLVKVVELDHDCRNQQVNDGCFKSIDNVPMSAITLTIPALLSATYMFCTVPGKTKTKAVYKTINAEISEKCPSTILRNKENVIMYIDSDSGEMIKVNIADDKQLSL